MTNFNPQLFTLLCDDLEDHNLVKNNFKRMQTAVSLGGSAYKLKWYINKQFSLTEFNELAIKSRKFFNKKDNTSLEKCHNFLYLNFYSNHKKELNKISVKRKIFLNDKVLALDKEKIENNNSQLSLTFNKKRIDLLKDYLNKYLAHSDIEHLEEISEENIFFGGTYNSLQFREICQSLVNFLKIVFMYKNFLQKVFKENKKTSNFDYYKNLN